LLFVFHTSSLAPLAIHSTKPIIDEDTIQVEGTMRIDDANEKLELELPEGEYETVAGFIIDRLRRLPDEGDSVDYNGLRLVVSESRGPRVEQVTVIRRRPESG
jgi:putative hemolysin